MQEEKAWPIDFLDRFLAYYNIETSAPTRSQVQYITAEVYNIVCVHHIYTDKIIYMEM